MLCLFIFCAELKIKCFKFRFLEQAEFLDWQEKLIEYVSYGGTYCSLSSTKLRQEVIPRLAESAEERQNNTIHGHNHWTVSLYGWKDVGPGVAYYAVMLINHESHFYVDTLELDGERNTPLNLRLALKICLGDKISRVKAVVTDSSARMVKFRQDFSGESPHIVPLGCVLHSFDLICKDIFSQSVIKPIVKKMIALVSFFTDSPFWNQEMKYCARKSNSGGFNSSFKVVRWNSLAKLCITIKEFENEFKKMLSIAKQGCNALMPTMISDIIKNNDTHKDAHYLTEIIKPIANAIAGFEKKNAHLGQVLGSFIEIQKYFDDLKLTTNFKYFPQQYKTLLNAAEASLNKRASQFNEPIYLAALFLSPQNRRICLSKMYDLQDMAKHILGLANIWDFSEYEARTILESELGSYYKNEKPHHSREENPILYWESIRQWSPCLAKLASIVFQLVPSSVSAGHLFSKSKPQNQLERDMISNVGKIQFDHQSTKSKDLDVEIELSGWAEEITALCDSETSEFVAITDPKTLFLHKNFDCQFQSVFTADDESTEPNEPPPKKKWAVADILKSCEILPKSK